MPKRPPLLKLAKDWFTGAVSDRGFGAKSAIGYGYFQELEDKTDELKYEFAEKLSLDEAYHVYHNQPNLWESVYIDIDHLVESFPKFAVIITEEICETGMIGEITDIPELLIEDCGGYSYPLGIREVGVGKDKRYVIREGAFRVPQSNPSCCI